jgi:hypothetical protein
LHCVVCAQLAIERKNAQLLKEAQRNEAMLRRIGAQGSDAPGGAAIHVPRDRARLMQPTKSSEARGLREAASGDPLFAGPLVFSKMQKRITPGWRQGL